MPKLKKLSIKQEKFCLKYIELGNASEAYRQAYDCENMKPESINRKATELTQNGKITARVKELQEMHVKRHMVTVDSITDELNEAKGLAFQLEQISAGVSAIMGKAKIHGLDKLLIEGELKTVRVIDMTGKK